jgi:hypothetical protein
MTIDIQQVQPGDLITASFFNDLIEQLVALDSRLAKLEGGTVSAGVVISALDKTVVHIDENITITGQNFGFSLGATRVRFDGLAPVAFGAESSDTTLVCRVPPMPTLPPGGGPVTLSVTNLTLSGLGATASRTITVLPVSVPQAGNIDIQLEDVSPDILTADAPNEFRFTVQSDALLPALVTFAPKVTVGGQPVSWATAVLDKDKNPLGQNRLSLAPGQQQVIWVRVSIPANTNGTQFTLLMEGVAAGLPTASAGLPPMTVGQGGDPDPTFTLAPNASPALFGSTITSSVAPAFAEISVEAMFTKAGTYDLKLVPVGSTTGWAAELVTPANTSTITITDANLIDGSESRVVQFRVQPSIGASDPGQLRLSVQRQGASRSRTFTFDLNVA